LELERKTSIRLYAIALILTAVVFLIGIYVGNLLSEKSLTDINGEITDVEARARTTQLLFLLENSSFCPIYGEELSKVDTDVETIGYKLSYLEERNVEDIELKKYYFLLELDAFLFSKRVEGQCGGNYSLVLYFYSNKNCSNCKEQGYELLDAKKELGESVRIYSFDGEIGSAASSALMKMYGVSTYPTIVLVGENSTLLNFSREETIINGIKEKLQEKNLD